MSTITNVRRARPGDEVAAYCGRCKDERTHQVIALNSDGAPATVVCRTCGEQHRYRTGVAGAQQRKSPRAARRRAGNGMDDTAGVEGAARARGYSARETFAEGEWVDHPKFGLGRVMAARSGKIEVRFGSAARVLIHAG